MYTCMERENYQELGTDVSDDEKINQHKCMRIYLHLHHFLLEEVLIGNKIKYAL